MPVGKVLALVGESGCGKTSIAMALLGHARAGTRISGGSVWLQGRDVLKATDKELRRDPGRHISYVAQDPTANLSPRRTIESQMVEAMVIHGRSQADAAARARQLIGRVELPETDEFMKRYPFELSGGQQQRVLIAMALSCSPTAVVLDEPTTGLDVTTQARVLEVLTQLAQVESVAFVLRDPRSRGRRPPGRQRRGHVLRPSGRDRQPASDLRQAGASVHQPAPRFRSAHQPPSPR